jgi:hypothetical protein
MQAVLLLRMLADQGGDGDTREDQDRSREESVQDNRRRTKKKQIGCVRDAEAK